MKHLYLLLLLCSVCHAQTFTFSNTTATNVASGGNANVTVAVTGVPATGMVLRQVNIRFGSTATINSGNVNAVTMSLRDVPGTTINLLSPASFDGAVGDFRLFNIRLRDHAALKTPRQQKNATSSVLAKGYPFYYGYYRPEGAFSSFNTTTNVNGNWTFTINNASAGTRRFTGIDLIFGPPITVTDIRSTDPNQSCATRQCMQTNDVYWASNQGYPVNQASAPPNSVGGCAWNAQKDNMIWFYFKASATTAEISASGFSTVQESSVFSTPNCATYTVVAGGCGPSDMFTAGFHAEKYNTNTTGATYTNGYAWNAGYKLTGLTVGQEYIFVLDGQSAVNTDFYIELAGGGDNGCTVLPVELLSFNGKQQNNEIKLDWESTSEVNNDHYLIEKSLDNKNWIAFQNITSKQNASKYSTSDVKPSVGVNYYRLKQFDLDGKANILENIMVNYQENLQINAYPNPLHSEQITIQFNLNNEKPAVLKIVDVLGRTVFQNNLSTDEIKSSEMKLHLNSLKAGVYFILLTQENITLQTSFIKVNED